MAATDAKTKLLELALDVRRGFKRFVDVPVADRPAVVEAMRKLGNVKVQENTSRAS